MSGLMGALGLDNVSADPNDIPDGKYDGVVYKSEYVLHSKNGENKVSHVTTVQVTSGDRAGAQRQRWDLIGLNPLDANGQPATKVAEIASFTPAQSEQNKQWYKKFLSDLGITDFANAEPEHLVGKEVTFGVKSNGAFKNINFAELREPSVAAPVSVAGPGEPGFNPWA
jgi:hypothetical protein